MAEEEAGWLLPRERHRAVAGEEAGWDHTLWLNLERREGEKEHVTTSLE